MVYLDAVQAEGCAVYFDLQSVERSDAGLRLTGMVGDGRYEGEVLIELGGRDQVTFVDDWLAGPGFRDFLRRCDGDELARGLTEAARSLGLFHHPGARAALPHGYGGSGTGSGLVAEEIAA